MLSKQEATAIIHLRMRIIFRNQIKENNNSHNCKIIRQRCCDEWIIFTVFPIMHKHECVLFRIIAKSKQTFNEFYWHHKVTKISISN